MKQAAYHQLQHFCQHQCAKVCGAINTLKLRYVLFLFFKQKRIDSDCSTLINTSVDAYILTVFFLANHFALVYSSQIFKPEEDN